MEQRLEEFMFYASHFDGVGTDIITHKKTPKKVDREEAKQIQSTFNLVQREDGVVQTETGFNKERFSDDLPFEDYKRFLDWAGREITYFEAIGTRRGIEAMISFIKMVGLWDELEAKGFDIDKVYHQVGWAGTLISDDQQSRSFVNRQREHFGYYKANLRQLLENLVDSKGQPYYIGEHIEEEE